MYIYVYIFRSTVYSTVIATCATGNFVDICIYAFVNFVLLQRVYREIALQMNLTQGQLFLYSTSGTWSQLMKKHRLWPSEAYIMSWYSQIVNQN